MTKEEFMHLPCGVRLIGPHGCLGGATVLYTVASLFPVERGRRGCYVVSKNGMGWDPSDPAHAAGLTALRLAAEGEEAGAVDEIPPY